MNKPLTSDPDYLALFLVLLGTAGVSFCVYTWLGWMTTLFIFSSVILLVGYNCLLKGGE